MERGPLPVDDHHLALTLPRPLTQLVMAHGDVLYSPLMQVGGQSILSVGERLLGPQLCVLCVLIGDHWKAGVEERPWPRSQSNDHGRDDGR
ncbi:MAG: hypothetical protein ACODAD_04320 [Planctomycetota bacterium]